MSWTRYFAVALVMATTPLSALAADISVLLPLTGATAKASESIRDGLLAGYYQALAVERPVLACIFTILPPIQT